jgi:archaetidylinositol phosphate synthase
MLEKHFKKPYDKFIGQLFIDKVLLPLDISSNKLTLLGVIFGFLCMIALSLKLTWLAFAFLLLAGLADSIDGSLARHQKTQTSAGSILDILSDRIVEAFIVLGLFFYAMSTERAVMCLLMLSSILICVSAFLVTAIFNQPSTRAHHDKGFAYHAGLIERAEAFIFFGLMILLPNHFLSLSIILTTLVLVTSVLHVVKITPNKPLSWK